MNKELQQNLNDAWTEVWEPPANIPMWQWCEENIYLSRRVGTSHPGPYRTNVTPWVKFWFDCVQDPECNTLAVKKGAQIAFTQTMYCCLMYWMVEDPDPTLVILPNTDLMKSASRLRIQPLIEDNPKISATLTDKADDLQQQEYKTKNTFVRLIGANSPANLASFPHRFLIMDEVDKFKANLGKEGSVIGLASQRTKDFRNRFRAIGSTPTTKAGYIERAYQAGTQHKYFVPCPECGHMFVMEFAGIQFDSQLPPIEAGETAYYKCPKKKCRIENHHKAGMVENGEWRQTATPKRKGHVSCHLPGIYSNSDLCDFSALVEKFMTVKDNKADLQDFINSDLGELWEEAPKVATAKARIWDIRDRNQYPRGTVPTIKKCFLVMVADVQKAHIPWTIWAMRPHDAWMVDHGFASVLEDLDDICPGPFKNADGESLAVQKLMIDTGYRTTEIYDFCLRRYGFTIPIKGEKGRITTSSSPVRPQKIGHWPDGRSMPAGLALVLQHIHPRYFKDELADLLAPPELMEDQTEQEAMADMPVRIHFHDEIDADFVDQVTGEVLMEDKPDKHGVVNTYWKKIRVNDFKDCCEYALALRYMMRIDLLRLENEENEPAGKTDEPPEENNTDVNESRQVTYDDGDDWDEF